MKHHYFDIKNFKGIDHIRLDFSSQPRSNIYTLVGLNESGKTTILEAINALTYTTETLGLLELPEYYLQDVHEFIPIRKRSNFNETIIIEAGFCLDDEDNHNIKKCLKDNIGFNLTKAISNFSIKQSYQFHSSRIDDKQPKSTWDIEFIGKSKKAKRSTKLKDDQWQAAIQHVRTFLPRVLYFPNFLFEFPDRIYLDNLSSNNEKHEFYRKVLQDVLDSIGDKANLREHILDRAKDGSIHVKRAIESVLLKMGTSISSTILKNWSLIFNKSFNGKQVIVDCDKDENGLWFLQIRIRDGNEIYEISERSLGFRWFFAFLLLTQYKGFRENSKNHILFLLDEPASNLHASAQGQLLKSFGKFKENCYIVYTTHSHYMINYEWLEGTFVVKNEGLDYGNNEEDYNYSSKNTSIILEKYRSFAANHPDQTTYFQPILDVLDYSPSKLENIPDVVMIEGKNDFYTLKYFLWYISYQNTLNLMPGNGSGSLENVIRLYLAWGREFIVLLDSDTKGEKQKQRYNNIFGILVKDRIFSLEDINKVWENSELESILCEEERIDIQKICYPKSVKFNKTHFSRAIQELFLTKNKIVISDMTKASFVSIGDFCIKKLKLLRA